MKTPKQYILAHLKTLFCLARKRGAMDLTFDLLYNLIIRKNKNPYYLNRASIIVNPVNLHIAQDSLTTIISLSVSPGIYIQCNNKVFLGKNVLIAPYVKIISSNHSKAPSRAWIQDLPIVIEDDVWIGTSAIILPRVTVSKGITIGAGTVVPKSLNKQYQTYVGNPAREIL